MAQLTVLGVSYKTASLCVREKLTFDLAEILACSRAVVASGLVRAIAIVSTCHRVEFYCDGLPLSRIGDFWGWLRQNRQFPSIEALGDSIYYHTDTSAVTHLLRVSTGLDSLILGETQILGQMKMAYDQARMAGTLGKNLTRLFQFAFGVAKKIRTQTAIGTNSLSVACIATRLVRVVLPESPPARAMFIGSGEMIAIAARHFHHLCPVKPIFANRTQHKARQLAEKFQGEVCALSRIADQLAAIDVLVTATASPVPLIDQSMVAEVLPLRRARPLLLIDLAVPRDIHPAVGLLSGVHLYTVDDLQEMAMDNRQTRETAAVEAEKIVKQKSMQFMRWLWAQAEIERIRCYRHKCAAIRESSIQEALVQLNKGKSPEVVMQHLAHRLTNRLIHEPTVALRQSVFNTNRVWDVLEPSVM
jgi:glutamyl-tRNA reductase